MCGVLDSTLQTGVDPRGFLLPYRAGILIFTEECCAQIKTYFRAHTWKPSTNEAEQEFDGSQGYAVKTCLRNQLNKQQKQAMRGKQELL